MNALHDFLSTVNKKYRSMV